MIAILFLFLLPTNLLAGLVALFIRVAWGNDLYYLPGKAFVVRLSPTSWPMRSWYQNWGGTTFFGHFVMVASDASSTVLEHEPEHVEQFEILGLLGLLTGIALSVAGWWWVGLIAWTLFPVLGYLGAVLIAVLHGRSAYKGNAYERAAHALEKE